MPRTLYVPAGVARLLHDTTSSLWCAVLIYSGLRTEWYPTRDAAIRAAFLGVFTERSAA